MHFTVKVPALMLAKPPRNKSVKLAICAFDTTIEIPELSDADMHKVVTLAGDRDYRVYNGDFYAKDTHVGVAEMVGKYNSRALDANARSYAGINAYSSVEVSVMKPIAEEALSTRTGSFFLWPENVQDFLKYGSHYSRYKEDFTKIFENTAKMKFDVELEEPGLKKFAENPADRIRRYETRVHELFSNFVSVDGALWKRVKEPTIACAIGGRVHFHFVDDGSITKNLTLSTVNFSVRQYDEMREQFPDSNFDTVQSFIIHDESYLSAELYDIELLRVARLLNSVVEDEIVRRMRSSGPYAMVSDDRVMSAWVEFKDAIKLADEIGDIGMIEDKVTEFLDFAEENDPNLISRDNADAVRTQIDRYRNRPMDFASTIGLGPSR